MKAKSKRGPVKAEVCKDCNGRSYHIDPYTISVCRTCFKLDSDAINKLLNTVFPLVGMKHHETKNREK